MRVKGGIFKMDKKNNSRVISIHDFKKQQEYPLLKKDLNTLLSEAIKLQKTAPKMQKLIEPMSEEKAKQLFKTRIIEIFAHKKIISSELYLCASYIASLLVSIFSENLEGMLIFDSFNKGVVERNDTLSIKKCADSCFLISSVFIERMYWGSISPKWYETTGENFYWYYYRQTGAEIGGFMSVRFPLVVEITKECLKSL
jgi:hypothetical protein